MSFLPILIKGHEDADVSDGAMWDGSYNFYRDHEGFLSNYPGKSDFFYRVTPPATLPATTGTPPAIATEYTRLTTYRDALGKEHLLFVKGDALCVVEGNGWRRLLTFSGFQRNGLYFPHFVIHESKLIILNEGDIPHLWDGMNLVRPLGVHEVPMPPQAWATAAPGTDENVHWGIWKWGHMHWMQTVPVSGPSQHIDSDDNPQPGFYSFRVQFADEYGHLGPVSAPSNMILCPPSLVRDGLGGDAWKNPRFLGCDWTPPMKEAHHHYVVVGRTMNLNPQAAEYSAGREELYYISELLHGVTMSRHVSQFTDADLVLNGEMDLTVRPPPPAVLGCSHKGRLWLVSRDQRNLAYYSDAGKFGQFRPSQVYRAKDDIVTIVSIGDRIVFITKSSTEVVYESSNGPAVLEVINSLSGRNTYSFVEVPGAVFGLFNQGWGFYDGTQFIPVKAPYFLSGEYLDLSFGMADSQKIGDSIYFTVRKDFSTSHNSHILIFNITTKEWFVLEEEVFSLTEWQGKLFGSSDSIYQLFSGNYPASRIKLNNFFAPGLSAFLSHVLLEVRLLMEASSSDKCTITIGTSDNSQEVVTMQFPLQPGTVSARRDENLVTYWNKPEALYADGHKWSVPGISIITPRNGTSIPGRGHNFIFDFPDLHQIRLRALLFDYGNTIDPEYG